MRVLHAGYGKSGNSWLYTIVRLALDAAGHPRRGFWLDHPCNRPLAALGYVGLMEGAADVDCVEVGRHALLYEIGRTSAFAPILDVDDYVGRCRQIWTHAHAEDRLAEIVQRVDRVVYIVRDVRDVAVSNARYMFAPENVRWYPQYRRGHPTPDAYLAAEFRGILHDWARHVYRWLRRRDEWGVHVVLYERLLTRFDEELDRLLAFLGLQLDEAARRHVAEKARFDVMRQAAPQHLQSGTREQWRGVLSPAQLDEAQSVAGPLLRLLGYRTPWDRGPARDPELPPAIEWHGWIEGRWPHPDGAAFTYPDLVKLFREALDRAAAEGASEVAGWGAGVCGRALADAAEAQGVALRYLVDRNPSLHGEFVGGVPVVAPGDVGRSVPVLPFVIASLASVDPIECELRDRFGRVAGFRLYAPIPGRALLRRGGPVRSLGHGRAAA